MGQDAVDEELDKFEGPGGRTDIARETYTVTANGDPRAIGVFLVRLDFTTTLEYVISLRRSARMSSYWIAKKVSVPGILQPFPPGPVPMPWQRHSSSPA